MAGISWQGAKSEAIWDDNVTDWQIKSKTRKNPFAFFLIEFIIK